MLFISITIIYFVVSCAYQIGSQNLPIIYLMGEIPAAMFILPQEKFSLDIDQ